MTKTAGKEVVARTKAGFRNVKSEARLEHQINPALGRLTPCRDAKSFKG